jgi:hypothetical protein
MEFISRLISHIQDKYFRVIRYYGFLSTRTRSELLPKVKNLLRQEKKEVPKITYRSLSIKAFGKDPAVCPICESEMIFIRERFPLKINFEQIHQNVALGNL